ncbi:MAG TPA: hypothetical protein VGC26_03340 [Afipia sp.]
MAYKELFFVQVFGISSKNHITSVATYYAIDAGDAVRRASSYAERGAPGAIAFSQMIDEKADDALEPTLLAAFGNVPEEAKAA